MLLALSRSISIKSLAKMANTTFTSGAFSVAIVTIGNMEDAKTLSKKMLEKNLVASINMIPGVQSMYQYKGSAIEELHPEVIMFIKTRTSRVPELRDFVMSEHPYEVAQFITTKIDQGSPDYLKWIGENVAAE